MHETREEVRHHPLYDRTGGGDAVLVLKTIGLLVVLMTVISAFVLGGMVLVDRVIMPAYTHLGSEVELPDVVEEDFYDARSRLTELGLQLERVEEDFNPVISEGHIIDMQPPAYSRVKKGRTVRVVVSRGPEEIIVPDLVRMSEGQARSRLQEMRLTLGTVTTRPDNAPEGTIIGQNPSAGTKTVNPRVDLVVSTGPETRRVRVPNLVNLDVYEAIEVIKERGGRVWIEWVRDEESLLYTVLEQKPEPGTQVEGSPIFDLEVSLLPGAREPALQDTVGIGAPPPWVRGGGTPERSRRPPRGGTLFPPPEIP
ncbi:MAG: PASTA domain-containing protein [bacterium]